MRAMAKQLRDDRHPLKKRSAGNAGAAHSLPAGGHGPGLPEH